MPDPYIPEQGYPTDGSTTEFSFFFLLLSADDLVVWFTPAGQPYDPVGDIVSNYTVSLSSGLLGGTVIFDVAPPSGGNLLIKRQMVLDNPTAFSTVEVIDGPNLDAAFLRETMLIQQVSAQTGNYLRYPENIPSTQSTQVPVLPDLYQWQGLNGEVIAVKPTEDPGASTLRTELASETEGATGASMIGCYDTVLSQFGTNVQEFLEYLAARITTQGTDPLGTIKMFMGDVGEDCILLNDTTLGSAASGAFYADPKYENLFTVLWNRNIDLSYMMIFDENGIPTTRGVSAAADFSANKRLSLPKTVGRNVTNSGNPFSPDFLPGLQQFTLGAGGLYIEPTQTTGVPTERYQYGQPVKFFTFGTLPSPLNTVDTFYVAPINGTQLKVFSTIDNASTGAALVLSGGSGQSYIHLAPETLTLAGTYGGSSAFVQSGEAVGKHQHTTNAHFYTFSKDENDQTYLVQGPGFSTDPNITTATMACQPLAFYAQFGIKYQ
jgi:hypothetical protein